MSNELHFKLKEITGDTLDVSFYGGEVHIEIDEPWAGSTEGGFGHRSYATLDKEQALELARWIQERYGDIRSE